MVVAGVFDRHGTRTILAILFVGEGLVDVPCLVAVEPTVLASVRCYPAFRAQCRQYLQMLYEKGKKKKKKTYHGNRVAVRGCFGVPLQRYLARGTGIGAVAARLAWLIGTHSPTSIHGTRSDGDQACVTRERALSSTLLLAGLSLSCLMDLFVVMAVAMVMMVRGLDGCNERKKRCCAR